MMTHTPGPWEIKANLLDIETRYGDWHYIDIKGVALVRDPHTPEGKANATLIAAAPDLLAALETVMPWASKAVADHYNQKQGKRALDIARAAIAKATQP